MEAGQLILEDEEIKEAKVSVKKAKVSVEAANPVDNFDHQGNSEQVGAQGGPAAPVR